MQETRGRVAPQAAGLAGPAGRDAGGPVIVVTYAHAGAELLRDALSADPSMACTSGTGVLPLCQAALATWRAVEARDAPAPSALAIRSVRALASTMITTITAGVGASRWCETSHAAPDAAEAFLKVFPSAAFVCLHRTLAGVLADGLKAYPWGLGGSPFWPFAGPHPGNNSATITAYWAECTEQLLDFEDRHHDRCLRVTYENLATDRIRAAGVVYEYLGLNPQASPEPRAPQEALASTPPDPDLTAQLPRLPRGLLAKTNELHRRLGYPEPSQAARPADTNHTQTPKPAP